MKNNTLAVALSSLLLASTVVSTPAQAALIDYGNGLIGDTNLDITWLKNANLAAAETFGVSGINVDTFDAEGNQITYAGTMTWNTAVLWVQAMNDSNYLGYNTWRLPSVSPLNPDPNAPYGGFNYSRLDDGTHDRGYNISEAGTLYAGSTANELANLFYVSLENNARCQVFASYDDASCLDRSNPNETDGMAWGLQNQGPFENLQAYRYWTKTLNLQSVEEDNPRAFDLNFSDGQVGTGTIINPFYVIPVLDGVHTSVVPVPAAAWLFGSGLIGLVAVSRRRGF